MSVVLELTRSLVLITMAGWLVLPGRDKKTASVLLCCDAQLWSGQQFLHNNDGASVAIALQFPNVGAAGQSRPPASGSNRTHPWHHGHYTATHNNWGIMRVNIVCECARCESETTPHHVSPLLSPACGFHLELSTNLVWIA